MSIVPATAKTAKLARFSIALNFITITALSYLAFVHYTGTPIPPSTTVCASCDPQNCYPPICDTSARFDVPRASKMIENYRNNQWIAINRNSLPFSTFNGITDNEAKIDARACWFDMDTLKKFINTIETYSCSHNTSCPDRLKLGIRIYYAAYPTDPAEFAQYGIANPEYKGMHTLLMVPTFNDGTNNVDFDPMHLDWSTCTGVAKTDTFAATIFAMMPAVADMNHGGLTPPPYPCGDYWSKGTEFMRFVDQQSPQQYNNTNCPPTGH